MSYSTCKNALRLFFKKRGWGYPLFRLELNVDFCSPHFAFSQHLVVGRRAMHLNVTFQLSSLSRSVHPLPPFAMGIVLPPPNTVLGVFAITGEENIIRTIIAWVK
jgi:hypothetical protein